jgi:uncharacterized membrane protein
MLFNAIFIKRPATAPRRQACILPKPWHTIGSEMQRGGVNNVKKQKEQLPGVPSKNVPAKTAHQRNKATRKWARKLLRGHLTPAAGLLLGGFLLAVAAGLLPLLLDVVAERTVSALPPFAERAAGAERVGAAVTAYLWAKAGGAALLLPLAAVLCAPLRLGREAWYFGGADGRKRSGKRVLFWLQPRWALKAARFMLAISLRKLLWAVLYLLPGAFLLVGTLWQARAGVMDLALFLSAVAGGAVLLVLGLAFYLPTVRRYALVPTLLAKQPRCKLRNALRLSAARMDGQGAALLRFEMSFLPWLALCLLVLPGVFVLPWYTQSLACRHKELLSGGVFAQGAGDARSKAAAD